MGPLAAAKYAIDLGSFWLPKQGSTLAPEIDRGWDLAMYVGVIFFILVMVPLALFIWKYRRRHENEVGKPTGHSTALEIGWTVVPLAVVMGCFLVGFRGFMRASIPPAGAYEIDVTAHKWAWHFSYPTGKASDGGDNGEGLRVPAGVPIKMVMSSQDVIHSFFIPEFRVKQDVVPGSYTSVWFQADKPLTTVLECSQYCGRDHSRMLAHVVVMPKDKFDQWVSQVKAKGTPVQIGEGLYKSKGCSACHSTTGARIVGPTFKGVWGRHEALSDGRTITVDANYVRKSILDPQADIVATYPPVMPSFKGQLTDDQINDIIAFLKTLK